MVVSGAKGLKSPIIPGFPGYDNLDEKGVSVDKAGTLYGRPSLNSKMCRQDLHDMQSPVLHPS